MKFENPKDRIRKKIQEIEYEYWFDQREFGKVMIIASLALIVVSVHALMTMDSAVSQANNSTERLETTAALVGTDSFQQSMESLAATGATIQGQSIEEVVANLEYASQSVDSVENLSNELESARTTYQWTVLLGLLGMTVGITSIYI